MFPLTHLMYPHMKRFFYILSLAGLVMAGGCSSDSNSAMAPGTAGTGGSMARFAIGGNHLYTVTNSNLKAYDISQPADPKPGADIKIGVRIETIFPYGDNLFIGSQTGMHIYGVQTPGKPAFLSTYTHVQSCDPVVVQGNYAYVTLRNGNTCRTGQNLLDVIDIRDLQNPRIIQSYPMQNPHGLGIDGNTLFVCEGQYGLKVFDASRPDNLTETQFIPGVHSFDVIPRNQVLIVVGKDGLYQYNYSDPKQLSLLSKIPIVN